MILSSVYEKYMSKHHAIDKCTIYSTYIDPIRKRPLIVTPEEIVRQKTVGFLCEILNVPEDMLNLEENLTYYGVADKGRIDIVVFEETEDDNLLKPIAVVECKAKNVGLSAQALEQAIRYADAVGSNYVLICDGNELISYIYVADDDKYIVQEGIPTYEEMMRRKRADIKPQEKVFSRTELSDITGFPAFDWCIGEDTPTFKHKHIINLAEAFLDTSRIFPSQPKTHGIEIVADLGLSYRRYGNASGSTSFGSGIYRILHVNSGESNNAVFCFSVLSTGKAVNDGVYGTRDGLSVLVVARASEKKDDILVQINLNSFLRLANDNLYVYHNGKFGFRNSRSDEFISQLQYSDPDLVKNGQVFLGILPATDILYVDNPYMINLITNLIRYCEKRSQYRDYVRTKSV